MRRTLPDVRGPGNSVNRAGTGFGLPGRRPFMVHSADRGARPRREPFTQLVHPCPAGAAHARSRPSPRPRSSPPAGPAPPSRPRARPSPTTPATVSYRGHEFTVPASWQVVDLEKNPDACVRFDRHAVYLGTPGGRQDCPARLRGRTEALLIQPATAAGSAVTENRTARTYRATADRIAVTAAYGDDRGSIQRHPAQRRSARRRRAGRAEPRRGARPRGRHVLPGRGLRRLHRAEPVGDERLAGRRPSTAPSASTSAGSTAPAPSRISPPDGCGRSTPTAGGSSRCTSAGSPPPTAAAAAVAARRSPTRCRRAPRPPTTRPSRPPRWASARGR